MKTLIIVDLQKDFYDPAGSLYVTGAEALPARIAALVPSFDNICFTLDWHPLNHCSFSQNGGPWPVHCLKYSWGASLPDEVLEAIDPERQSVSHYHKGNRSYEEEYAAYGAIGDDLLKLLKASDEIEVTGLCGDYCVGLTVRRLVELGLGDRLVLNMDCIGSIDGGTVINAMIKELNLKTK